MQSDKKVEIGTQKSLNLEKTYPKKKPDENIHIKCYRDSEQS